jgi:cell division septal protein FtsQ
VSTGVATGLLDRRRAVAEARHRRRRTMLLAFLAAVAAFVGAWWIGTGPLLGVKEVSISGYRQPDQARLVATVRIAARHGTMLKLPTVAVREALADFPWVANVEVHHNWLRGVDVTIVQATPVAIAVTASGARLLVSGQGRVLGPDTGGRSLPTFQIRAAGVGAELRGAEQRAPFTFLRSMNPRAAATVRSLRLDHGVMVGRVSSGLELRVGPPTELSAKARAYEAVVTSRKLAESLAGAGYLDLSSPKQPTLGGITQSTTEAAQTSTTGQASAPTP